MTVVKNASISRMFVSLERRFAMPSERFIKLSISAIFYIDKRVFKDYPVFLL